MLGAVPFGNYASEGIRYLSDAGFGHVSHVKGTMEPIGMGKRKRKRWRVTLMTSVWECHKHSLDVKRSWYVRVGLGMIVVLFAVLVLVFSQVFVLSFVRVVRVVSLPLCVFVAPPSLCAVVLVAPLLWGYVVRTRHGAFVWSFVPFHVFKTRATGYAARVHWFGGSYPGNKYMGFPIIVGVSLAGWPVRFIAIVVLNRHFYSSNQRVYQVFFLLEFILLYHCLCLFMILKVVH